MREPRPLRNARRKLREEGLVPLLRSIPTFLRGQRRRAATRIRRARYETVERPRRLIHVHPGGIERYQREGAVTDWNYSEVYPPEVELFDREKAGFKRRRNVGLVVPGDWDRRTGPFEALGVYRMLEQVLEEGYDWEETPYLRKGFRNMERGYEFYGYSTRAAFVRNRIPLLEELHESMAEHGYLTQAECSGDHRTGDVYHEISVNVGRDGELIFNNRSGNHRLSLAKLLDIEEVPVLVIVRHPRWQAVREAVRRADSPAELGDRARGHLDHPDVRYLADEDWP